MVWSRHAVTSAVGLLLLVSCQRLADLSIPTYAPENAAGAASGSSGSGGQGGGAGGPAAGGQGGLAGQGSAGSGGGPPLGGGGACTVPEDGPPCPEHVLVWFDANHQVEADGDQRVLSWTARGKSAWKATGSGGVKLVDVAAGKAVHFEGQGLKIDTHQMQVYLPSFGIFGAFRFQEFPSHGEDNPFGTANLFCMANSKGYQSLYLDTSNSDLGARYFTVISGPQQPDGVQLTDSDEGLSVGKWGTYATQYRCDGACMEGQSSPEPELYINDTGELQPVPIERASLDKSPATIWTGIWDTASLGDGCQGPPRPLRGDIGELLLYDEKLDPDTRQKVRLYLANRWP